MIIKKYRSSRKKTNSKTKKSKESLKVSSLSAISDFPRLSGGFDTKRNIRKSRHRHMKSRKTKGKNID